MGSLTRRLTEHTSTQLYLWRPIRLDGGCSVLPCICSDKFACLVTDTVLYTSNICSMRILILNWSGGAAGSSTTPRSPQR